MRVINSHAALYEIALQNALNESFMPRKKIAQEPPARFFGLALKKPWYFSYCT
jgi:hypothetical protein